MNYKRVVGKSVVIASIFGMAFQLGCGSQTFSPAIVDCSEITFSEDVEPIIEASCAIPGCHVPNNPPRLDFTEIEEIQEASNAIRNFWLPIMMPPAGNEPLTSEEVETIFCWIDSGALDN